VVPLAARNTSLALTNADGLYTLPGLPSGAYELQAELTGFSRAIANDVTLTVGATLTMDFTMKPAAVEESVTVSGAAPVIQATKSEVQSTLRTQELQELPMVNRNFAGLVALMPSARVGAPHDTTKQTMGGLSFGGSNGVNVNMVVDGGDNRDDWNGGLLMGVALTQRPELFNAIAIQVPLLDMQRYNKLLAGASWMAEYGDPDKPARPHRARAGGRKRGQQRERRQRSEHHCRR